MQLFKLFGQKRPEDRFADLVMRRIQARGWPHELRYEPEAFSIRTGGDTGVFYLGNVFRDWLTYPKSERAAQIDHAIAHLFENSEDASFEEVADRLLPVVRNITHMQAVALANGERDETELWQAHAVVAGPLCAMIAIDQPHSISLIAKQKLEAWGCSFESAMQRAMANLIAASPVQFREERGFFVSDYGDTHDASRVLLPELFRGLPVDGEPVAVVASRTCIAVAGSRDHAALNAMAEFVVATVDADTRPISYLPLVLQGEQWRPFESEAPQLGAIRDLFKRQAVWDYGSQAPGLEAYAARCGHDVYVAPLEVVVADETAHTWTSWAEGVPVWSPKSDGIGMTDKIGRRMFRAWEDVTAVCGRFEADSRFHPPRFLPPAWPSSAQWRRLEEEFRTPGWWAELEG